CSRRPASPLRPPPAAEPPKVLVDSENVRREGVAVPEAFEWALPEDARGRLRFCWTAAGRRGVSIVAELLPAGGGPARTVGRDARRFPGGPPVFFDEDLDLP